MDPSVLDVALSLGSKLLSQVGRVLVLDVLDDGIPAAIVVDEVAISGSIDNGQPQPYTVLLDYMRNGMDLSSRPDDLLGVKSSLGLDKVRGEDGVDQRGLAETGLACI